MRTARILGSVFAILVLVRVDLAGQAIPRELRQAMEQRHQAIGDADAEAWDRLTADDFTVVGADGRLLTKAERLAELRSQSPAPLAAPEQEQIQSFGDVVVRRLRTGDLWVLESWVRSQHGWRVSSTQATLADGPSQQAARAEIAAAIRSWEAKWSGGDAAGAAAGFTTDAINMRPGAASDAGRNAVEAAFRDFLSGVTVTEISFTTEELDVHGDTAYEHGSFVQRYTGRNTETTQRSRYMAVWRRGEDGVWRYHRFLFNDLPSN
jgi:uncharacterized protein (TIGR02246 family)